MVGCILLIGIVVYLLLKLDPTFDSTSDGKWIVWYNGKDGTREYRIIYDPTDKNN